MYSLFILFFNGNKVFTNFTLQNYLIFFTLIDLFTSELLPL